MLMASAPGGPQRVDHQLQVAVAHPAARVLRGGPADRVGVGCRVGVGQRDQQPGSGDLHGPGPLLGAAEGVQRLLAHGAVGEHLVAGAR